jgi:ligand-binding sensor domain-containing protein
MIRFIGLGCLFLISIFVTAQEPKFIQHDIGNDDAVALNVMLQDHQCMIWLGTAHGLSRYDGISRYSISLDTFTAGIGVTALYEDKDWNIWIGTDKGIIFYLDMYRNVHVYNKEEGHPAKKITSILQDKQGRMWFATYGEGVYVDTGSRVFNINQDDGLTGNDIYDMVCTGSNEIWLGTDDGINIIQFEEGKKEIRNLGLADGLPDQIITALKTDENENVWIGTSEAGVVFYDADARKIQTPFDCNGLKDEITSFAIFDNHELWIGTKSSGVWRYSPDFPFVKKLITISSPAQYEVTDLLADIEGNIWIAMHEGFLLSAFRTFETVPTDIGVIQTLFCDHQDALWVGTKEGGLYKLTESATNDSKLTREAPSFDANVTDIVEDNFHNLWIATMDKGLFIYMPSTGQMKQIKSSVFEQGIMSMDRSEHEIWIASLPEVVSYPTNKNIVLDKNVQFQLLSEQWTSNLHFVFQVFVDSKGKAWFATLGNGVYGLDKGEMIHYQGNDSLQLRTVNSICEDRSGHLWFNTHESGLIDFDGTTYKPVGLSLGLASINVTSLASTQRGDVLIAHDGGIDLMEPARRHFMYYTNEIGVEKFESGDNVVATDSRRNVYIGGKNLIIKYYAANHDFTIDPRTQITEVRVNQEIIDFNEKHIFSFDKKYFSFDYIGLWYTSPHSVKYDYKLENYDVQWKESQDNKASYSNLSPGTYTFLVKASENKFFFNEPIARYSFTIKKPFWANPLFIGFIILLGGLLIYVLIKSRDKRAEKQALLKKEMIESQLQALKAQINPHFLFNSFNTLITIIDENALKPKIAIEYVEKLSDYFRSILQYREQETISLEEEWELVQNFGYLLEKRYGSNLRLHLDPPPKEGYIIPLTLQMLLENAVKHNVISEERPLDVRITIDKDQYITVSNNLQPKSKVELSTQFGLQSIFKRYNLLSERKVVIEKDQYTFKVRIPIIHNSTV